MIITDERGTDWICLARLWDGFEWRIIPELMMDAGLWNVINYAVNHLSSELRHKVNTDNTLSIKK